MKHSESCRLYEAWHKVAKGKLSNPSSTSFELNLADTRFYLRLSHDLMLIDTRCYEYASKKRLEIGRLLGACLKACI